MVNENATETKSFDKIDITLSAQVTAQNKRSNAIKHSLDASSTSADSTQKDSTSPILGDCETAREESQAPMTFAAARQVHSFSTLKTARVEAASIERSTREHNSVTYTEQKGAEKSFTLTGIFPSLFGVGNVSQPKPTVQPSASQNAHSNTTVSPPSKILKTPRKPMDSRQDVIRFRSYYASQFANGSSHKVNFFSGSYEDAQREAKGSVRLLVVFIHDPSNKDSVKFIRETLNSRDFDDFATSNHLLVWGVSSHSEEGKYVAYTLHVLKFPFISLMCPRADNRMFCVRRIYGFLSPNDLVKKFQKSIESTKQDFRELREKRIKLLADRQIREEQEREYKESAERDKRKIMEARRSCQEKQKTEKIQRRRVLETEARRKVIATQRGQLRLQSPEHPVSGEMVSVQVRLPSGDNFVRRFSLDDSLEKLFNAIISHKKCPDFFTVASGFPRRPIHCAPEWYHTLLSEQLAADGLNPPIYHPAHSFRDAGLRNAFAVFVNNCRT